MKTVKLSDFSPYDRNKGGIQELHHKIEPKTLQYWGEDSGILIGITPIYKRHLWRLKHMFVRLQDFLSYLRLSVMI